MRSLIKIKDSKAISNILFVFSHDIENDLALKAS